MVGVPLRVWSRGGAFAELEKKSRIEETRSNLGGEPLTLVVAQQNARLRWFLPIVFIVFCLLCFFAQKKTFNQARNVGMNTNNPAAWVYGQTQSPFVGQLVDVFNTAAMSNRFTFLTNKEYGDNLAAALFIQLRVADQLTNIALKPFRLRDTAGDFKGIDLTSMVQSNAVTLSMARVGGPNFGVVTQRIAYCACGILSQALTAYGWTLALWVIAKFAYWVRRTHQLLPAAQQAGRWRFKLLLTDPQRRFGLGPLFEPYNLIVFATAAYALYSALQTPEAVGRAAFTVNAYGGSQSSRVGNLIAIVLLTLIVVLGPMLTFAWRVRRARTDHLDGIAKELGETSDPKRQVELLKEEDLVSSQTTWPQEDKMFRAALAAIVAFLIIPVADKLGSLPSEVSTWINLPRNMKMNIQEKVADRYHLPPDVSKP